MKNFLPVLVIVLAGFAAWFVPMSSSVQASEVCSVHQVLECPFCNQELALKKGICKEHKAAGKDIPEALCYLCNKELKKVFIQEKDWCKGHSVPESQCTTCLIHGH